jgi:hypothetical protein
MVLQKLIWYREGGGVSDRQWCDVIGVIKTQGSRLDLVYLHLWAGRKGLADLLERALSESRIRISWLRIPTNACQNPRDDF